MNVILLVLALCGCDLPGSGTPPHAPAGPDEGWVDGGGVLVPPMGVILSVSGADQDGLRVWTVSFGEQLDCGTQLEHDLTVEAANAQWTQDGDVDALQEAIAAADRALYPAGTWKMRLDLGRRASGEDPLVVNDIRLFAERRTADGVDVEVTAAAPDVENFDGDEQRAAGTLEFGSAWTGDGLEDDYYEFEIGFDATFCE